MKFQYHNPIRFVFGSDALDQLPELCRNRKVLLVYGGGSIRRNGVYDKIQGLLKDSAAGLVEYGGCRSAAWQTILDGVALARREHVDAVVEVGGASAMDTGKAIAFGAVHENLKDCIEALAAAYPNWLEGVFKYHPEDIRALFTEVFDIDPALEDDALVKAGCARLRALLEQGGVPLSLSDRGGCPAADYVSRSLAPEDFGEFTPEEMHRMVAACYR